MKALVMALVATVASPAAARAADPVPPFTRQIEGRELLAMCEGKQPSPRCQGFIEAAVQGLEEMTDRSEGARCLPASLSNSDVVELVLSSIRAEPAGRPYPVVPFIWLRMAAKFNCKFATEIPSYDWMVVHTPTE